MGRARVLRDDIKRSLFTASKNQTLEWFSFPTLHPALDVEGRERVDAVRGEVAEQTMP